MEQNAKSTILCVDDSKDQLELVRRWLKSAGYEVLVASSAVEAMQVLASRTPDLILLDVIMPVTDGYQLCAQLQSEKSLASIPVIFLTALYTRHDKAKAFSAGGIDFLVKPVKQERLLETVQKYLVTNQKWKDLGFKNLSTVDYRDFLHYERKALHVTDEVARKFVEISTDNLYAIAPLIGVSEEVVARNIATYLNLDSSVKTPISQ